MDKRKEATLKIFGDELSQPVRSVLLFCDLNKIPYTFIKVNLTQREQFTNEELKKVNPNMKVPAITYSDSSIKDFALYESCTILRFLADNYKVDEFWYNRENIFRRSLIDQHLDWHHMNTRYAFYFALIKEIMGPAMIKLGGEFAEKIKSLPDTMKQIPRLLKHFDKVFKERDYIVDNQISIADLIYSQEFDQIRMLGFDLKKYEYLQKYMDRISSSSEAKNIMKYTEKLVTKSLQKRNKNLKPKF